MSDESHVIKRDGSAGLANQSPPTLPTVDRGAQHDVSSAFAGHDKSVSGEFPVSPATFEKVGTGHTPRHQFPKSQPKPSNPEDLAGWHKAGPALLG
jgi:hypothetical protein